MKESPAAYRELFKVFSVLLANGILSATDVNDFADRILSQESESAFEFIELSTIKNRNELISFLNSISKNCNEEITSRAILGILYNLKLDTKTAKNVCYHTALKISMTEPEKSYILHIDDSLELAFSNTYGDYRKLSDEFQRFLKIYREFNLNNFSDWNNINLRLESTIIKQIRYITAFN